VKIKSLFSCVLFVISITLNFRLAANEPTHTPTNDANEQVSTQPKVDSHKAPHKREIGPISANVALSIGRIRAIIP
jgi:hypothetical protein